MEILQFLVSLMQNNEKLAPILQALQQNNFDLKKTLFSLDPKILQPFVEGIMNFFENKSPTVSVGQDNALAPISNVADKDIIYTLNKILY